MSLFAVLSLFVVMVGLAVMPSASVALVVTRSATLGVRNGIAVALGIVLGDLVFVALAIVGMTTLAETMGAFFVVFKVVGGAYLVWLGIGLIRSRNTPVLSSGDVRKSTVCASAAAGFVLTLGDVKAIFFYASLLPTFVDMATLTRFDVGAVVLVTCLAVGGVKVGYAVVARRLVGRLRGASAQRFFRTTTGSLLVGAGTYVVARA